MDGHGPYQNYSGSYYSHDAEASNYPPQYYDQSNASSSHNAADYESGWGVAHPSTSTPSTSRPTSRRRGRRRDNDLPMHLNENHYLMMHSGANKVIQGVQNNDIDDPSCFDQMISAAISIKHTFDQSKADPAIIASGKSSNTGLCHDCLTTVSSVWRSGPDGQRTLCNACGLRWYKAQQKKKLELQRREQELGKSVDEGDDGEYGHDDGDHYSHY